MLQVAERLRSGLKQHARYLCSCSRNRVTFFFFQAEDGIRDWSVTGVQTCALPISPKGAGYGVVRDDEVVDLTRRIGRKYPDLRALLAGGALAQAEKIAKGAKKADQIGRASCRGRGEISVGAVSLKKKK